MPRVRRAAQTPRTDADSGGDSGGPAPLDEDAFDEAAARPYRLPLFKRQVRGSSALFGSQEPLQFATSRIAVRRPAVRVRMPVRQPAASTSVRDSAECYFGTMEAMLTEDGERLFGPLESERS
jgi:hypothetical protein